MAIAITRKGGIGTGVDATSFSQSFTATAGVLGIAVIGAERGSDTNPATPTVTHNSITATEIASLLYVTTGATRHKMWLFAWDTGAGSASTALTANHGVSHIGSEIQIYEVTGSDLAAGLAQTFVQTVMTAADLAGTSGSMTLGAASDSGNRPFASFAHGANEAATASGGWTSDAEAKHANPNMCLFPQWRTDAFDTSAAQTWTTSSPYGGIAVELKVAGGGGGGGEILDPMGMRGFFGG